VFFIVGELHGFWLFFDVIEGDEDEEEQGRWRRRGLGV
jgi:hypothetical protein